MTRSYNRLIFYGFLCLFIIPMLSFLQGCDESYKLNPVVTKESPQRIFWADGKPYVMSPGTECFIIVGHQFSDNMLFLNLLIKNQSNKWISFDPKDISVLLRKNKLSSAMTIYTADEYLDHLSIVENLRGFFVGMGNVLEQTTSLAIPEMSDTGKDDKQPMTITAKELDHKITYKESLDIDEDTMIKKNTLFPGQKINGWVAVSFNFKDHLKSKLPETKVVIGRLVPTQPENTNEFVLSHLLDNTVNIFIRLNNETHWIVYKISQVVE